VHESPQGATVGRVVETEAYFGPPGANPTLARRARHDAALAWVRANGDPASHSFRGPTRRNGVMFGPPGHAYVYLIYGLNECLNVSTGAPGDPQAVLFRALAPVAGEELMQKRRGVAGPRRLASGPGKLTTAMGVTRAHDGRDLTTPPLYLAAGARRRGRIGVGPRVGVTRAAHLPFRYWIEGDAHVSRR